MRTIISTEFGQRFSFGFRDTRQVAERQKSPRQRRGTRIQNPLRFFV